MARPCERVVAPRSVWCKCGRACMFVLCLSSADASGIAHSPAAQAGLRNKRGRLRKRACKSTHTHALTYTHGHMHTTTRHKHTWAAPEFRKFPASRAIFRINSSSLLSVTSEHAVTRTPMSCISPYSMAQQRRQAEWVEQDKPQQLVVSTP